MISTDGDMQSESGCLYLQALIFYFFYRKSDHTVRFAWGEQGKIHWGPVPYRRALEDEAELHAILKKLHDTCLSNYLVMTDEDDEKIFERDVGQTAFKKGGSLFDPSRTPSGIKESKSAD